jgi:hypothetical protein
MECGPFLEIERTIETNISALKIGKKHEESYSGRDDSPPPMAEKLLTAMNGHFPEK